MNNSLMTFRTKLAMQALGVNCDKVYDHFKIQIIHLSESNFKNSFKSYTICFEVNTQGRMYK